METKINQTYATKELHTAAEADDCNLDDEIDVDERIRPHFFDLQRKGKKKTKGKEFRTGSLSQQEIGVRTIRADFFKTDTSKIPAMHKLGLTNDDLHDLPAFAKYR